MNAIKKIISHQPPRALLTPAFSNTAVECQAPQNPVDTAVPYLIASSHEPHNDHNKWYRICRKPIGDRNGFFPDSTLLHGESFADFFPSFQISPVGPGSVCGIFDDLSPDSNWLILVCTFGLQIVSKQQNAIVAFIDRQALGISQARIIKMAAAFDAQNLVLLVANEAAIHNLLADQPDNLLPTTVDPERWGGSPRLTTEQEVPGASNVISELVSTYGRSYYQLIPIRIELQ